MTSINDPLQRVSPATSSFPPVRTLPSLATGTVVSGLGGPSLGRHDLHAIGPVATRPDHTAPGVSIPGADQVPPAPTPRSSSADMATARADEAPHRSDHQVGRGNRVPKPAQEAEEKDLSGAVLLGGASLLLVALASAQGYVSFRAQFAVVNGIKGEKLPSILEALGLDAAAVIFALLALALARLGKPALTERFLNLACAVGSLLMNLLPAKLTDPASVAVWVLPAVLYAAASDRVIAVVRRRALARHRNGDERSAFAVLASIGLWLLSLPLAFSSTFKRTRAVILQTAPIAPGLPLRSSPQDETAPADRGAAEASVSADQTVGKAPADGSAAHKEVRLGAPVSRRGSGTSSSAGLGAAAARPDQTVPASPVSLDAPAADGARRGGEEAGNGRQRADRARRPAPSDAPKAVAPAGGAAEVDPVRLAEVAAVADRLLAAGVPVTREAVRSEGVKGDNGLLGQLLKAWRAQSEPAQEEPANA